MAVKILVKIWFCLSLSLAKVGVLSMGSEVVTSQPGSCYDDMLAPASAEVKEHLIKFINGIKAMDGKWLALCFIGSSYRLPAHTSSTCTCTLCSWCFISTFIYRLDLRGYVVFLSEVCVWARLIFIQFEMLFIPFCIFSLYTVILAIYLSASVYYMNCLYFTLLPTSFPYFIPQHIF